MLLGWGEWAWNHILPHQSQHSIYCHYKVSQILVGSVIPKQEVKMFVVRSHHPIWSTSFPSLPISVPYCQSPYKHMLRCKGETQNNQIWVHFVAKWVLIKKTEGWEVPCSVFQGEGTRKSILSDLVIKQDFHNVNFDVFTLELFEHLRPRKLIVDIISSIRKLKYTPV